MNKKPVILIVDDEVLAVKVLKRGMSLYFDALTAASYDEALEIMASTGNIALVLTDYLMPLKTGVDLLHTIQQRYPNTRRTVITGCLDETLVAEEKAGLIEAIIEKPIKDVSKVSEIAKKLVNGDLVVPIVKCNQ